MELIQDSWTSMAPDQGRKVLPGPRRRKEKQVGEGKLVQELELTGKWARTLFMLTCPEAQFPLASRAAAGNVDCETPAPP